MLPYSSIFVAYLAVAVRGIPQDLAPSIHDARQAFLSTDSRSNRFNMTSKLELELASASFWTAVLNSAQHDSKLASAKEDPKGIAWYDAYTDDEICNYFCRAQCPMKDAPLCQNCLNSCYSFQLCEGKGEGCLIDKACSVHAYNLKIKAGQHPDGTKPYLFCDKHKKDRDCTICHTCVKDQCVFTPGSTKCNAAGSECCAQRCLGAKPAVR